MSRTDSEGRFKPRILTLDGTVDPSSDDVRCAALDTVENGGVVLLLDRGFQLTGAERELISNTRELLAREPKKRNGRPTILFDRNRGAIIRGIALAEGELALGQVRRRARPHLEVMMARFGIWADDLVRQLFPTYEAGLARDRVTYRPNERSSTQPLHVDSSYGFPTKGRGMFRLFCNIDPTDRPRVWQVGEPFEPFAQRYLPSVRLQPPSWSTTLLTRLGVRNPQSEYDRTIAELRRLGKRDKDYQASAPRQVVEFPSGSCWFAITDLVLHGALSGQHSLDQTYFLPAETMSEPARSSLRILERLGQRALK